MSTSAVSSSSLNQQLTQYFQTRHTDLSQLSQALTSGDLSAAQTAYNNIVSLGQSGPFANGAPFRINQREQDFTAIGQALQSGDIGGAQQAFAALASTFQAPVSTPITTVPSQASQGTEAGGGTQAAQPEIVLNLSGATGSNPEQITINISNSASGGGEQVSLSVGNQGSSNPQELTLNLGANSNEQIILNLLGAASASSSTSGSSSPTSTGGSGLSVSA